MAVQKIHRFHALKPGSQIWFMPEKKRSYWTKLVDWYLNFQICKYNQKDPIESDGEIAKIVTEEEIQFDFKLSNPKNLMISSNGYLPTKAVIILTQKSLTDQIDDIQNYIKTLNLETIRVFLPSDATSSDFIKNWPSKKDIKISLVEDITGVS